MTKSNLSVEDVVHRLGVTPRTLHYYEQFGLIAPVARTAGGHRLYDEHVVDQLRHILRLKEHLGYSLQEIRHVLEVEKTLDELRATYHGDLSEAHRDAILEQYMTLLQELVDQVDKKLERLNEIREGFAARLERTKQLRSEREGDAGIAQDSP